MFHVIPERVAVRMRELEGLDAQDRLDGTPRLQRLRQITPDTGRFIALMAATAPPGTIIEIGTSAGYSTLWLALGCLETGRQITTFELLPEKAALASETFAQTNLKQIVDLIVGDARDHQQEFSDIAFCFLDAEKDVYGELYELTVPRMTSGGLLIADSATSHAADLADMITRAQSDERVDAMVVPVGRGQSFCRKK